MKKSVIGVLLALITVSAAGIPRFSLNLDREALAEAIVANMSDPELLGQVFFLGYSGSGLPEYIKRWTSERCLGGVKLFTRNVKDLESITRDISTLQTLATTSRFSIPLFIATDQEGGWVRHIKNEMIVVPGNLALGADGIPADTYRTAYYIGCELAMLGINMNFAPTVDVYTNSRNSVIGPRAFHHDPVKTGTLAIAYMKGMEKSGVLCTAKHFPGHGDSELDSHGYLPVIRISYDTLWDRELVPYRLLITEGLSAIMTGHLAFPDIIGDLTPSSLSEKVVTGILREKLRFRGIVVTDDLDMYGVRQNGDTLTDICYRAIMAGSDLILVSHSEEKQEKTWRILLRKMTAESAFRIRVRESAKRILHVKIGFFKSQRPYPLIPDHRDVTARIVAFQERESRDFVFQTACRSTTVIRSELIPFAPKAGEKTLIVGQYASFIKEGRSRYPDADSYEYSYYPQDRSESKERRAIGALVARYDRVIYCLANSNSLEILQKLEPYRDRIIVMSVLTPVYLKETPWVRTAIAIYGAGRESFEAGFAVLGGDFWPAGSLPVKLEG